MTLDRIKRDAQLAANRENAPQAVLNLNPVGAPMYVIREPRDGDPYEVCRVYPQTDTEEA